MAPYEAISLEGRLPLLIKPFLDLSPPMCLSRGERSWPVRESISIEARSDTTVSESRSLPCKHGREVLPHSLSGKDGVLTILADPTDESCCVDEAGIQCVPKWCV